MEWSGIGPAGIFQQLTDHFDTLAAVSFTKIWFPFTTSWLPNRSDCDLKYGFPYTSLKFCNDWWDYLETFWKTTDLRCSCSSQTTFTVTVVQLFVSISTSLASQNCKTNCIIRVSNFRWGLIILFLKLFLDASKHHFPPNHVRILSSGIFQSRLIYGKVFVAFFVRTREELSP